MELLHLDTFGVLARTPSLPPTRNRHPRHRQVEAGSFSFVILYVQKLLEISITSRVELKILEGEIKGGGGRLPSDFTGDEN